MTSLNNVGQVSVKITVSVNLEICEAFEEWEDTEIEAIAAVESLLLGNLRDDDDNRKLDLHRCACCACLRL